MCRFTKFIFVNNDIKLNEVICTNNAVLELNNHSTLFQVRRKAREPGPLQIFFQCEHFIALRSYFSVNLTDFALFFRRQSFSCEIRPIFWVLIPQKHILFRSSQLYRFLIHFQSSVHDVVMIYCKSYLWVFCWVQFVNMNVSQQNWARTKGDFNFQCSFCQLCSFTQPRETLTGGLIVENQISVLISGTLFKNDEVVFRSGQVSYNQIEARASIVVARARSTR